MGDCYDGRNDASKGLSTRRNCFRPASPFHAHPPTPEQRCDKIAYDSHTDRNDGKPGNALQKCKRGFVPDIVTPSRKWRGSLYQLVKVARPIV